MHPLRHAHSPRPDDDGVAPVTAVIVAVVALAVGAGVAYAVTDGFGRNSGSESTGASSAPTATDDTAEPDYGDSPMEAVFAAGVDVVCTYTYEAYDATTTLQSKEVYRIDQSAQGGMSHVIRGPERTYVWVAGMSEAMEFSTADYEAVTTGEYPTFDPAEFDTDELFNDGTCRAGEAGEGAFELPAGMTSTPSTR